MQNNKKIKINTLQLEKAAEINMLAGGIAHEFNNLLSGISGYIETLENSNDATALKVYEKTEKLISRAEAITARLLNLSKISEPVKSEFLPETEIQSLLDLYSYKLIEKNISLKLELYNTTKIHFNISDFNSIISNLLINAIEAFTENSDNQKITIKTSSDTNYYYLSFWDSRGGIKSENIDNIFKPFFTTKIRTSESGTGLGLAIIKKIIFENYGDIKVFSEQDKFTEFKIKLPLTVGNNRQFEINTEQIDKELNDSVCFIDAANPENFIIKDYLLKNNLTVLFDAANTEFCQTIIIDDRMIDTIEPHKFHDKNIVFLFSDFINIDKVKNAFQHFYFLTQPLGIDELILLYNFIINNSRLPFY